MQEIWVVCVKTSMIPVPMRFGNPGQLAFYDNFEKARESLRRIVKTLAFSEDTRFENRMFNKKGQIVEFDTYIAAHKDASADACDNGYLSAKMLAQLQDSLTAVFSGQDVTLGLKDGIYTDGQIKVQIQDGTLLLEETDEVRYRENTPMPWIKTNILSMEKEQNYYLFIIDQFDPNKEPNEVYIYLEKDKLK